MTHHMQSRELKMYDIIDLMVIFNVLVNEWPLKAHQINNQISRHQPAPDWLTAHWPSGRHHAADSRCCITAGPHWCMSKCLRGPTVCLLCTYSAKSRGKEGKHTALFWGTPKIPQSLSTVKKRSWDVLLTAPSALLLWLLSKQEDNNEVRSLI